MWSPCSIAHSPRRRKRPSGCWWCSGYSSREGCARASPVAFGAKRLRHGSDQPWVCVSWAGLLRRVQPKWGLIGWTAYSCRRFKVDRPYWLTRLGMLPAASRTGSACIYEGSCGPSKRYPRRVIIARRGWAVYSRRAGVCPDREYRAQMVIDEAITFRAGAKAI